MTVGELIEKLQDYDPELEVRVAHQPGWPLQEHVSHVTTLEEATAWSTEDEEDMPMPFSDVVFIVSLEQVYDEPYAPREVMGR